MSYHEEGGQGESQKQFTDKQDAFCSPEHEQEGERERGDVKA